MQKIGMQILWSVIYVILESLVFILGLNFLKSIPEQFQDVYKIGLPIIFLIMYFLSQRYVPNQKTVFWAFLLVSVGWMLDFYLTSKICRFVLLEYQRIIRLCIHHGNQYIASFLASDYWLVDVRSRTVRNLYSKE